MSVALTFKKPIEDISFLNKVFCPWEIKTGGCLSHTGYWITFLVLGLLTCFIPIYLLLRQAMRLIKASHHAHL